MLIIIFKKVNLWQIINTLLILAKKNINQAYKFAKKMKPIIEDIKNQGYTSIRAIRDELNRREIPTAKNGIWHIPTVFNLLNRYSVTT